MIPQKNISQVSNSLYQAAIAKVGKAKARRIPENVIERDYVLAWILMALAKHPELSTALAFKGGTALRRIHFGEYRFSEDLDFSLTRPFPQAELYKCFREVFATLRFETGIKCGIDESKTTNHQHNDTLYFDYKGPLPAPASVKVDISRDETIVFPLEFKPVIKTYPEYVDFPEASTALQVYSFSEIVVEKTLAVTDNARREPRDLYDLWFILSEGHVAHPGELITGLNAKLASRPGREHDMLAARLEKVEPSLKAAWEKRLDVQVESLPGFDDCYRAVHRLMDDFDSYRPATVWRPEKG